MAYLYLLIALAMQSAQQVLVKQYNIKSAKPDAFLFGCITSLFAMIFFIATSGFKLDFNISFLPYSVAFGIAYSSATVFNYKAIMSGPLSITALVMSYSLIIPTLFGIIFLKDPMTATSYIGIALLLVSLFLINIKKENLKFSPRWIIFIIIAFIGNGMCSTIQKMQQLKFNGAYKSEFMIVALMFVVVSLAIIVLFGKDKPKIKDCIVLAPCAGLSNGTLNLLVMVLTGLLPNAILFPSISAGGIVIMFFISRFIYKEHLSNLQITGYILGVMSVVFLNI